MIDSSSPGSNLIFKAASSLARLGELLQDLTLTVDADSHLQIREKFNKELNFLDQLANQSPNRAAIRKAIGGLRALLRDLSIMPAVITEPQHCSFCNSPLLEVDFDVFGFNQSPDSIYKYCPHCYDLFLNFFEPLGRCDVGFGTELL